MLTHQSPILQWHGRARRNPTCCALALCSPAKARIRVWLWPGLADPLASRSPSSPSAWRLPASGAHHWTTPTRALAAAPAATGQRAPQKNTPGRVGRSIGNFGRPRDKAIPTRRRRARSAPSRSARASHHNHQPPPSHSAVLPASRWPISVAGPPRSGSSSARPSKRHLRRHPPPVADHSVSAHVTAGPRGRACYLQLTPPR